MGTRRKFIVLLAVTLVLVPSAVGLAVAQAQAGSFAPLREAGFFSITPSAGPGGAIDPDAPQAVAEGGSQAFTITPALGHQVADVLVDGGSVGAVTSYTFDNVTADHTISATFALDTFTITPSAGANGTISPAGAQTVDYGGSQTFTITPDTGYRVADVEVDGASIGARRRLHLHERDRRPHHQRHVRRRHVHDHAERPGANGTISPAARADRRLRRPPGVHASPRDTGYHVADVLVDGASIGAAAPSYTFTNVTADHTISATFAVDTYTITPTRRGQRHHQPGHARRPSTTAAAGRSRSRRSPATTSPTCWWTARRSGPSPATPSRT